MANPRFNEGLPFGQVLPPTNGAFYEQDGSFFNQFKEYLGNDFNALGSKGAVKAAPASPAKPKANPTPPAPAADEGDTGDKGELNLAAWSRGEEKYGFFSVKAAIKALLPNADVSTAKLAKTALVEAGMVPYEDVKW